MAGSTVVVIGGVDTHGHTHQAAAIDSAGRVLGDAEFEASLRGYRELLAWLRDHGTIRSVGVEGTGSYGAGLCRHLLSQGVNVIEVDRPDRRTRRAKGKSDPIDAECAARAVLAGVANTTPKDRKGVVESIRMLRIARSGAVKARTAAVNALRTTMVTAPEAVRAHSGEACRHVPWPASGSRPSQRSGAGSQARAAHDRPQDRGIRS